MFSCESVKHKLNILRIRRKAKAIWRYLDILDQVLLVPKRVDVNKRLNYCVYEKRLSVIAEGNEKNLNSLLKGEEWCSEKGIILINAPSDGYAKDYFAIRLMIVCFDSLMEKRKNGDDFLVLESIQKDWFRIPVLIEMDTINSIPNVGDFDKLLYLCINSIRKMLEKNERDSFSDKEYAEIEYFMTYMLEKGHVLFLFPRGSMEMTANLYSLIVNMFCKGKTSHGNLAIYVVEEDKSFCNPNYGYFVELDALLEEEILDYIHFVLKNEGEKFDFFKRLIQNSELLSKELQIPERLLSFSKFFLENTFQNLGKKKEYWENLKM